MADESTRWEGIVGYDAGYRQSVALRLRPSDVDFPTLLKLPSCRAMRLVLA